MKIVHVCHYYAPRIGGVETHVSEVAQRQVARGNQVVVITSQHDRSQPTHENIKGVAVLRKPLADDEQKFGTWRWMWQHRHEFEPADVVQVHDVFWWVYPLLPMIEDKVFTTFHGWEGIFPVPMSHKLHRLIANVFSKGSVHIGAWIQEFYWDKPDIISYGGVNQVSLKINSKKITPPLTLVFFGRLSRDNDVQLYLHFIKALGKKYKLAVTWVGDGELATECKKVGKVTGFVTDPQPYLIQADLVLASSYLSILSAQALRKLVLAFYSHRLKQRYLETYPGATYMFIADSVSGMLDRLETVLSNKQTIEKKAKAAHAFAKTHTWDKVVEMYEELWLKQ